MELVNQMYTIDPQEQARDAAAVMRHGLETVMLLLSPIVPHFCEEIWSAFGHSESILLAPWPRHRSDALVMDEATVVVQINGKLRSKFPAAMDTPREELQEKAMQDERIQHFLQGMTIRKVIVVPNKLVNIVAS
ncbi:MAG: class I tRNA ligase family protein, partial [Desulfosarcinaceae bacterium]